MKRAVEQLNLSSLVVQAIDEMIEGTPSESKAPKAKEEKSSKAGW